MKNVTITLDEETATWARIYAAKKNVSLSRYVGEFFTNSGSRCDISPIVRRCAAAA